MMLNSTLPFMCEAHAATIRNTIVLSVDKTAAEVPKYMKARSHSHNAAMTAIWLIDRDSKTKQVEEGEWLEEDVADLARWL